MGEGIFSISVFLGIAGLLLIFVLLSGNSCADI